MKIGRNESCPCGSGKKYKKCCLDKSDEQRLAEAVLRSSENLKNEAHIKQCLHPNKDECDEKIIKAHAIQNNRILNKISENGMIISMDGVQHLIFQTAETKGRKIATVFTGFCKYHDKILFQEIEDKPFTCTSKQLFLLTYRTMAWHYHKKQEQINATCIHYEKLREEGYDLAKSNDFLDYLTMLSIGNSDNDAEKKQFEQLNIVDRENYFNNNLPRWTDSIVISPRLWDYWQQPIQEAFITHANFDVLYRQMEQETNDYAYKYMDTPWNLFDNLAEQ